MNKYVIIIVVLLLAVAVMRRRGASAPSDIPLNPTDADVDRLIMEGRKVEAIKAYRQIHGTDLKDSKDAVDAREKQLRRG
jgi:ribosomal protein L7/L12